MKEFVGRSDIKNQLYGNFELRMYILECIDKAIKEQNYTPFHDSFLGILHNYGFVLRIPVQCSTVDVSGKSPLIKHKTLGQIITRDKLHDFVNSYYGKYYEIGHPFYISYENCSHQDFLEATFFCKQP